MFTTYYDMGMPGSTVTITGVYGKYHLGQYTHRLELLERGDTFPAALPGVTYLLHATF